MEDLLHRLQCEIARVQSRYYGKPTRIILGIQVYKQLIAHYSQLIVHTMDEVTTTYFMGIPITVDVVDVTRCSVCLEFDIPVCGKEEK